MQPVSSSGIPILGSADLKHQNAPRTAADLDWLDIVTLATIGASIALFVSGKREVGIFIGLWPPTIQALRR